ncbi:LysM peptidoglycan-binding domain-containing protein [Phototrophicus methaneseepsis]|uniref:LysM peptidoglycan-binding domain-containing protein n=1 Tax=Phototrophicus methaneseepsis TaxID=2710758 RepID=A0A7S8ID92_9CHLR|nr:LysM peptidoglycan-binding domain-containing protein [Phototrophicus methaneseepsis]QPC81134.1 LysM peptidoglycan-binding domain-containing protein [Phototrophicus methaneseepsis]
MSHFNKIRPGLRFGLLLAILLVFTTASNAQSDTANESAGSGVTIHVVQRGENLFRIALAYNTTTEELAALNGITNVSSILIGQRLLVPTLADPTIPQTHVVQAGETLATIAELYNMDWQTLLEINGLSNADRIYPGQVIALIPEALPSPTPTDAPTETPTDVIPAESPTDATVSVPDGSTENIEEEPSLGIISTPERPVTVGAPFLHTVQAGETLFRIATSYGLTVNDLVTANDIADPTRIYSGQQLIIPNLDMPDAAYDLPDPITNLQIRPLIFKEGETGSITIVTSTATTITGTFLGADLKIVSQENGTLHQAVVGIPMYTIAGIYPVELYLTGAQTTSYTFNIRVLSGAYGAINITLSDALAPLYDPMVDETELNLLYGITSQFTDQRRYGDSLSLPAAAAMNAGFGSSRSINGGGYDRYHTGADFATPPGTSVLAAAPGRVVLADTLNIRGNAVIIDHGWGVYTLYAHMTQLGVSLGDEVVTGQYLGASGSTGRSTGPHLHWEVWIHGIPVNPLQWLQTTFP